MEKETINIPEPSDAVKRAMEFRTKECQKRNIITKDVLLPVKDKDGNIVKGEDGQPLMQWATIPTFIPQVEKDALKVFIDSIPCWFNGCEQIREAYNNELKRTVDSKQSQCSDCKKGPVLRKYLRKVVEILQTLPQYNNKEES